MHQFSSGHLIQVGYVLRGDPSHFLGVLMTRVRRGRTCRGASFTLTSTNIKPDQEQAQQDAQTDDIVAADTFVGVVEVLVVTTSAVVAIDIHRQHDQSHDLKERLNERSTKW